MPLFTNVVEKGINHHIQNNKGLGVRIIVLAPLSTPFQLYRGCQFFCLVEETEKNHRPVASH
jgi:hypothetical protein